MHYMKDNIFMIQSPGIALQLLLIAAHTGVKLLEFLKSFIPQIKNFIDTIVNLRTLSIKVDINPVA